MRVIHPLQAVFSPSGLGGLLLWAAALLSLGAGAEETRYYNVPASSLETALNTFGRQAGILLSFDSARVAGLDSPGINGPHGVEEGLNRLAGPAGLRAAPLIGCSRPMTRVGRPRRPPNPCRAWMWKGRGWRRRAPSGICAARMRSLMRICPRIIWARKILSVSGVSARRMCFRV